MISSRILAPILSLSFLVACASTEPITPASVTPIPTITPTLAPTSAPTFTVTPSPVSSSTPTPTPTPELSTLGTSCFDAIQPAIDGFTQNDPQHRTLEKAFKSAKLKQGYHILPTYEYTAPSPVFMEMDSLVIGTGIVSLDYRGQQVTSLCIVTKGPRAEIYTSPVGITLNKQLVLFTNLTGLAGKSFHNMNDVQNFLNNTTIGIHVFTRFVRNWPDDKQIGQEYVNRPSGLGIENYDYSVPNGMYAAEIFKKNSYVAYATHFATTQNSLHVYGSDIIPLMTERNAKDYANQPGGWLVGITLDSILKY
jgi:hypothetical protein